jgi:hypothetical protein
MTNEQTMKLMEELGFHEGGIKNWHSDNAWVKFANLVAATEREACAQIAHDTYEGFGVDAKGVDFVKQQIIRQIKERGQV